MSDILNFSERSRIQETACRWLIRLDGGALTDKEAEAFSEWLRASLKHRDAIVELCRVWDSMEIISELSVLFPDIDIKPSQTEPVAGTFKRPVLLFNIAAATILAVLIVFLQYQPEPAISVRGVYEHQEVVFRTAIGECKEVLFEDGSVANMNTDSLLAVNFNDKQRRIHLIRGEVYFDVAHEPGRPFLVHTGAGLVRAVGTAFSVRLTGQKLEVIVTEGKVEIAAITTENSNGSVDTSEIKSGQLLATLGAGQTAELDNNVIELMKTIDPESVSRKLSWKHGMLEFNGESLEQVIAEISRYTNMKIIISDDSLRDIRIGGYFRTGEMEAFLAVLDSVFPVEIDRINENLVYLTDDRL